MRRALKLGLIGDNIARSHAPDLHRLAGHLAGIDVRYDLLVPRQIGLSFDALFARLRDDGYDGVNITYPYKERAAARVTIPEAQTRALGAINTVVFDSQTPEADAPLGFNTDHSGFLRAYRLGLGHRPPGAVCLIGAGGVGKAIAFGLLRLGATAITCVDLDLRKAQALADALHRLAPDLPITATQDVETAARRADGLVNCTPLGMDGIGGTPLPALARTPAMAQARWAFDAVYTPRDTQFLQDAARAGLTVLSGYELFLAQGVEAWQLFSQQAVDQDALRVALARPSD